MKYNTKGYLSQKWDMQYSGKLRVLPVTMAILVTSWLQKKPFKIGAIYTL